MNRLEIKNRTITTTIRYVEMQGFEYTIDNLNRVRLVGYIGNDYNYASATPEERKAHRELEASVVSFIRSNVQSVVREMDIYLSESTSDITDSRHTMIELA